jgi:Fic family protein
MSDGQVDIRVLDSGYVPFPTFEKWAAETSIDLARWGRYYSPLAKRATGASPELLLRAQNVAKRAAAIDTGAIEGLYEVDRGFTYTVAMETAAWEAALEQKGPGVKPLFEAQLHAYDYVLDLATKAEPISEAAIRALHEEVCRAQLTYRVITAVGPQEQELPKGQYKSLPNHVRTRKGTDHSYAPVDVTPAEMKRLVDEFRTSAFLSAHPVVQAAYAHYGFVVIHPFADGNGRVARALASAFTYRAISMPIVILYDQRDQYLSALESADSGNFQAFVDFMFARCLDTIGLVEESLNVATGAAAEESARAIQNLYRTRGGYTHEQVDQIGESLLGMFRTAVEGAFSKVATGQTAFSLSLQKASYGTPPEYRVPLSGGRATVFNLMTRPPIKALAQRTYYLYLPKDAASDDAIHVTNASNPADSFVGRIDQLTPAVSSVVQIRLKMFAERVANQMFEELRIAAQKMGRI